MVMEISGSMEDPHPHYEQLRRLGSVPYDTAGGNYWVLRHDDALSALTNRRFGKAPLVKVSVGRGNSVRSAKGGEQASRS